MFTQRLIIITSYILSGVCLFGSTQAQLSTETLSDDVKINKFGTIRGKQRKAEIDTNGAMNKNIKNRGLMGKPEKPPKDDGGDSGGSTSGQVVPSGVKRIGADPALNLTVDGTGIGVAVVDTGIDMNHPDLNVSQICFSVTSACDYVADPACFAPNPTSDCNDYDGHGTHVAGIIGAVDNDIDVVGVAPGVTLYSVKVAEGGIEENGFTLSDLWAALDWIIANAENVNPPIRVVNLSFGKIVGNLIQSRADGTYLRLDNIAAANIAIFAAAGNYPDKVITEIEPAGYRNVMAVASTTAEDGNGILANTASFDTTDGTNTTGFPGNVQVDGVIISAPGDQKQDLKGGQPRRVGILSLAQGGGTTRKSGTSMACPHVAGVAALMLQKNSTLTVDDVKRKIKESATGKDTLPYDAPAFRGSAYTFDGEREGIVNACGAIGECPP